MLRSIEVQNPTQRQVAEATFWQRTELLPHETLLYIPLQGDEGGYYCTSKDREFRIDWQIEPCELQPWAQDEFYGPLDGPDHCDEDIPF